MVTLKNENPSKRSPPQLTIPKNVMKLGLLGFNSPLPTKTYMNVYILAIFKLSSQFVKCHFSLKTQGEAHGV
jgi:hypothetical protein